MTELSFLIDLLLNHELQKDTKDLIAARIREVEEGLNAPTVRSRSPIAVQQPQIAIDAQPTMAAQNALAMRQAAIEAATKGGGANSMYKVRPK